MLVPERDWQTSLARNLAPTLRHLAPRRVLQHRCPTNLAPRKVLQHQCPINLAKPCETLRDAGLCTTNDFYGT